MFIVVYYRWDASIVNNGDGVVVDGSDPTANRQGSLHQAQQQHGACPLHCINLQIKALQDFKGTVSRKITGVKSGINR